MPSPPLTRTVVAQSRGLNIQSVGSGLSFEDNVLSGIGTATDVTIVDDNTTNAPVFLVWVTADGIVPEFISTSAGSFNPLTGLLDMFTTTQPPLDNSNKLASTAYVDAVAQNADFLSGYYYIAPATAPTIPIYKQMTTLGGILEIDGDLIVDGQLYVEA